MEEPVSWDWTIDRYGLSISRTIAMDPYDKSHFGVHWPEVFRGTKYLTVFLPLWVPFVLVVIPTILLWHRDWRRIAVGHCRRCGYDLTKNESGECPECGSIVDCGLRIADCESAREDSKIDGY